MLRLVVVAAPTGRGHSGLQPLDGTPEAVEQAADPSWGHLPPIAHGGLDVLQVPPLRARVEEEVEKERGSEARPPREESDGEVERHPVEVDTQELTQANIPIGHQRERSQEMLTELAVGDPRAPLWEGLEGQRVDEDGTAVMELDVVRARVLERHPVVHGDPLDPERRERGVPQLGEAPFVRVGDEAHGIRPHDPVRPGGCGLDLRLRVRDQELRRGQRVVQAGRVEEFETCPICRLDLPVEGSTPPEHEPGRVAEGAGESFRRFYHCRLLAVALGPVTPGHDRCDLPPEDLDGQPHRQNGADERLEDETSGSGVDVGEPTADHQTPPGPKMWAIRIAPGPTITTSSAGRMQQIIGNRSLTGVFIAFSSAR